MKRIEVLIFIFILVLAGILRLYKIGETPVGLYIDEAAIGYNAYSMLRTGKDEFGMPFPILFRSFTDFKVGSYEYMLIPIYKIFGMSVLTTRIMTTFWAIIGIIVLTLLVKKYSGSTGLALICGLLLSVSPWHILFSRTSYETSIALTLVLLGIYFVWDKKNKQSTAMFSAFWAALSILTYHSERLISPLLFLCLFLKFRPKRQVLTSGLFGLLIVSPLLLVVFTPGFLSRINTLSVFNQTNGDYILSIKYFLSMYSSYFSPRYLFNIGDPGGLTSYPDLSVFFVWQVPFWVWGIIRLVKEKNNKLKTIVVFMLLIFPIPAALTKDPFSSIRSLPMVIPHTILIGLGLSAFIKRFGKRSCFVIFLLVVMSVAKLYLSIFKFNDNFRSTYWNYGAKEVINYIKNLPENIPIVIDSPREMSYAHVLFFTQFDPDNYQKNNFEVSQADYYTNMNKVDFKKIGRIEYRPVAWGEDIYKDKYLVADALAISLDQIKEHCLTKIVDIMSYDNKNVIYRILRTNPKIKQQSANTKTCDI